MVLWQIVRLISTKKLELKNVPEIIRLAENDEQMEDLLKLKPENILIRWINFHLKAAGQDMRVTNLGSDIKDSKALLYVMNQLDSSKCSLEGLSDEDDLSRAEKMILNSQALGVPDVAGARDIIKGNSKVNTVFVAELFNTKHGLEELTKEEFEAAGLIDDDDGQASQEERQFKMWINSLQIQDCFVVNLYDDMRDGLVMLRVIDRIKPGVVKWSDVLLTPKNVFDRNTNCDECERCCIAIGVKMVGVGAQDIRDGNKNLILSIVWQLMRIHYLQIIGSKTEAQLLEWVNECSGQAVTSFGDPKFSDGHILIKLAGSIEPRVINPELVLPGETEEEKVLNCKYAISLARKLGAVVFLVYDDILGCNKKMMLIFTCAMFDLKNQVAH